MNILRKKAGDNYIWKGGSKYGDWLFYHPPVNNHPEPDGYTEHDFIATAFYAYSTSILVAAAKELGNTEDELQYGAVFKKIKEVFINEYVTNAGRVGTNSQTSYVLALMFNLLPENLREKSAEFLVEDIKSRGNHLSTGFLGTPYLCHVLSANGYTDVAYDLLLQESISFMALSGKNGCNNNLGKMGWTENRQHIPGSRDEFIQSLCLWCNW